MSAQLFPSSVATAYASLETAWGIGSILGPSLGGALFSAGGFPLPFFVLGSVLVVAGISSSVLVRLSLPIINSSHQHHSNDDDDVAREARTQAPQPSSSPSSTDENQLPWSHYFRNSLDAWIMTLSILLSSIAMSFPTPTLSLFLETLGMKEASNVGLVFLGGSVAYTLISLTVGKLADTYKKFSYPVSVPF